MWPCGSRSPVLLLLLSCVPSQSCQVGLNFASEEETKRFRGHLMELLDRRQRKSGTCSSGCRLAGENDMIPFNLLLKMSLLLSHILFQTGAFFFLRLNEPGTCHFSQILITQDQATKGSLFQQWILPSYRLMLIHPWIGNCSFSLPGSVYYHLFWC